ncbi:mitochondrial intermediate peptidase [Viridothelium virens]|uniref:Mitochondrial intermediate peptidase n=1 Tax=Viridothelium virens TaxID=1048519 RepID=A0A6A6HA45_VIRVR|nr:mitochondrial intermediate peptidase [Viridothelium virens]
MLKRLQRPAWICTRCLKTQQKRCKIGVVEAAATAQRLLVPFANHSSPNASNDDRTLRMIFDSQPFWKEFSQRTRLQNVKSKGLFQNRYLTRPEGFQEFAANTLQKCRRIVAKVLAASTADDFKNMSRNLDRLSDLLCRVIDLSDFVRSTHPDPRIQAAASQAYGQMFEYMNVLNTTTGLNDQLKKAMSMPEVTQSWTGEENIVAQILAKDFSRSAIDLPESSRQKFVELSSEIAEVGTEFVDSMAPAKSYLDFPSSRLKGMDPTVVRQLTKWGTVTLPTVGTPATMALRNVEDPDARREIYMASRTASKGSIAQMEKLVKTRAELAHVSGYDTFAHMALSDKMAKTPDAVNRFLEALVADNRPRVKEELLDLLELKKADAHNNNFPTELNAWDRDYYKTQLLSSLRSKARTPDRLSAYFSLGTVMQGLSRLFYRVYGIRLVPHETPPGETWNDDVRRLDVIDENDGHIAVVYCDLFARPGKAPNPAHFTLRCSRLISTSEIDESSPPPAPFSSPAEAANDGMATTVDRHTGSLYQLPTIALICDFQTHSLSSALFSSGFSPANPRPTLLTFTEVRTLFHEMGHALHSILGRTTLQNVSGTRCATDFAELPSILMENFATAPQSLALFARHWETDAELPYALVEDRLRVEKRMEAAETEAQIVLAALDQAYHGVGRVGDGWDSTRVYLDVVNRWASVPEPQGTAWQGFFGHLFGYGATYYAYLFDRAIAGRVWQEVFGAGEKAVERSAGQRMREEVLMWGGGRDGWRCVAGVLGRPELAEGGEAAMEEVGRWGVED